MRGERPCNNNSFSAAADIVWNSDNPCPGLARSDNMLNCTPTESLSFLYEESGRMMLSHTDSTERILSGLTARVVETAQRRTKSFNILTWPHSSRAAKRPHFPIGENQMSIKVLVVDDEPPILALVKSILEPLGCVVLTMSDSRQAAQLIDKQKVDGIFLDGGMPYLDGFQLTERIRKSNSNRQVPIVLLTGMDDADTMRRGFKAGISFFLGKPVTKERLERLFKVMRGSMLSEKRRYSRLPFRTMVACEANKKIIKLGSINISTGGMLIEPTEALQVGQEFDLEFSLPEIKNSLKVRAQALHAHPKDGVGIKFINLSAEDRQAVERYISGAM
jgi:CheY-like chemotaxis protein